MTKTISEWYNTISKIKTLDNPDQTSVYSILIEWAKLVSIDKQSQTKDLYDLYLKYFESIDINDYNCEKSWYSMEDLLKYSIFNKTNWNVESAIIACSEILWEIIIFKSDRGCKQLEEDDLRVFQDDESKKIYFVCDGCQYSEDFNGKQTEFDLMLKLKLIPAKSETIEKLGIGNSII